MNQIAKVTGVCVWKHAMELNEYIYKTVDVRNNKPQEDLVNNLKKSSMNIAINIADGSTATSRIKKCVFLSAAIRSAYEVICFIDLSDRLNGMSRDNVKYVHEKCDLILEMLHGLKLEISK